MIRVGMYSDFVGEPEEDYEDMEEGIRKVLPELEFIFIKDIEPCEVMGMRLDIYIVDYGGLGFGMSGFIQSMARLIHNFMHESPNIFLILWTSFTANSLVQYDEYMKVDAEEFLSQPNTIIADRTFVPDKFQLNPEITDNIRKLRTWMGYETSEEFLKELGE